jgi:dihydrofolate reductase
MSKVVAIMSMSLDGYVADLNDGVAEVFDWYSDSGDIEFHTGGSDSMTFKVSGPSAEHLRGLWSELGAVLTGRRTFDKAEGWGGNHACGPAFVLTHHIPAGMSIDGTHQVVRVGEKHFDELTGAAGATWEEYLKLWHADTAPYLKPK